MKKNKGFVTMEVMIGLAIISIITVQGLVITENFNKTRLARNVGEHIKQIGHAANKYTTQYYSEIEKIALKGENKNAVKAASFISNNNLFNGLTCNQSGTEATCKIAIDELKNADLLPREMNRNPFGSDYDIRFKVKYLVPSSQRTVQKQVVQNGATTTIDVVETTEASIPVINGLITTSESWRANGNKMNYALLGEATSQAGVDAGFTDLNLGNPNANKIKGYKGGWELQRSDGYENINKLGILAYRFGFHSGDMTSFLRRDGSLPMTGNLNMDNNDIKMGDGKIVFNDNQTINNQGGDLVINNGDNGVKIGPEEVETQKWICSNNELKEKICIGGERGDNIGGNFEIALHAKKPLFIHNNSNNHDEIVLRVGGGTALSGNLYVGDQNTNGKLGNQANDDFQITKQKLKDISGKEDGAVIANYSISKNGLTVLAADKKPNDITKNIGNQTVSEKYSGYKEEYGKNSAVTLTKSGEVISKEVIAKDIVADGLFIRNLKDGQGLHIKQIIPSYSSRGAFVVYDEDRIVKPNCEWDGDGDAVKKSKTIKGSPKIILSWGNIHSSGDEVDESEITPSTGNNVVGNNGTVVGPGDPTDVTKFLRKHRVIIKAEDSAPTYWTAIVKTRSFDGAKWVSAGQAVAHVYCQYY